MRDLTSVSSPSKRPPCLHTGPAQSQEPGILFGSPTWLAGAQVPQPSFPRHIRRELDQSGTLLPYVAKTLESNKATWHGSKDVGSTGNLTLFILLQLPHEGEDPSQSGARIQLHKPKTGTSPNSASAAPCI